MEIRNQKFAYLLVRECLGAVDHGQVLVLVDWVVRVRIFLLVNGLHGLYLFLFLLLFMGIDSSDEEPIAVILNVLNIWLRRLLSATVFLKNFKISHLHFKLLSVWSSLISNVVIHFSL